MVQLSQKGQKDSLNWRHSNTPLTLGIKATSYRLLQLTIYLKRVADLRIREGITVEIWHCNVFTYFRLLNICQMEKIGDLKAFSPQHWVCVSLCCPWHKKRSRRKWSAHALAMWHDKMGHRDNARRRRHAQNTWRRCHSNNNNTNNTTTTTTTTNNNNNKNDPINNFYVYSAFQRLVTKCFTDSVQS